MSLTLKQENFCLAYIETGNASEAYRRAYNATNMLENTVNRRAKELVDDGKITARLTEIRKPVIEAAQVTLENHLNDLKRLRDDAWASEKYGPAIQAEISRGKASGHYIERVESGKPGDFDKLSDDDLERYITDAAKLIESARIKSKTSIAAQGKAKAVERK